jgi:hypothetical protein
VGDVDVKRVGYCMMCDVMQYSPMTVTLLFPSCVCCQVYEGGVMSGARLKSVDELQDVFEAAGVDVQAPLVCR